MNVYVLLQFGIKKGIIQRYTGFWCFSKLYVWERVNGLFSVSKVTWLSKNLCTYIIIYNILLNVDFFPEKKLIQQLFLFFLFSMENFTELLTLQKRLFMCSNGRFYIRFIFLIFHNVIYYLYRSVSKDQSKISFENNTASQNWLSYFYTSKQPDLFRRGIKKFSFWKLWTSVYKMSWKLTTNIS